MALEAKGFMPPEEGAALYEAGVHAGRLGLGPLLEVGTYCGKSAVYLGAAARESGGALFSVDHHRGSLELQQGWPDHDPEVAPDGKFDTLPWARRTVAEAGLESQVVLVVGESTTVAEHWAAPLALLFIDGGHAAEVAEADFRVWAPKLAVGGLLAVHDVFEGPSEGGQVPYLLYKSLRGFEELTRVGSLRIARRVERAGEHERQAKTSAHGT